VSGPGTIKSPTETQICIFCHTPHTAAPRTPLWNRDVDAARTYVMPASATLQAYKGAAPQPDGASKLCLSCHDGTIAANQYGNAAQLPESVSTGGKFISTVYQIGKDQYLGNHHPIGFDYDLAAAGDNEIRNADAAMLTPTSFVRDHLYGAGNARMECGTCHSVHNKGNAGERLLWRSDQNSKLCLTCHDKGLYTAP
jgi:predicted CXXCH cytochrome family protein